MHDQTRSQILGASTAVGRARDILKNPTLRLRAILAGILVVMGLSFGGSKAADFLRSGSADVGDSISVLVASRYVPAFSLIKASDVRTVDFPRNLVPPGAIRQVEELQLENGQALYAAAVPIPEGQPMTRTVLLDSKDSDSLASVMRPGQVAVSFEVDRAHGVGGWIKPGDRLAIFRSLPVDARGLHTNHLSTQLLLPAVAVLAVDSVRIGQGHEQDQPTDANAILSDANASNSKVVTVLVTPPEATRLIEAREEGNLNVVLRAIGDDLVWPQVN